MAKKRPTLNNFLASSIEPGAAAEPPAKTRRSAEKKASPIEKPKREVSKETAPQVEKTAEKHQIIRHTLYLPLPVIEQLEGLVFEEQRGQAKKRKVQDYLHEAIDLLFKNRGLKSIAELTGKE